MNKTRLAELFRSWFNDFMTVNCFAAYYCLDEKQARRVIRLGRLCHNKQAEKLKQKATE